LLKAAYIYNFAKFVEWPAASFNAPDSPLTIAIVGRDPMAEALKTLEGKEVRGRRIAVFRWEHLEQSAPCHILYIGSSERKNLGAIFKKVAAWDVLTVGAMEEFIHQGGIIMFFLEKNKVRFEINPDMASWKKLHISSHLMRLSRSPEKN
ncbi:MAG: YfiR family protein, partial [Deltaproteobacteria bacterium]|nr:YfiR family protein [Deltaproteobacteria bacterium]